MAPRAHADVPACPREIGGSCGELARRTQRANSWRAAAHVGEEGAAPVRRAQVGALRPVAHARAMKLVATRVVRPAVVAAVAARHEGEILLRAGGNGGVGVGEPRQRLRCTALHWEARRRQRLQPSLYERRCRLVRPARGKRFLDGARQLAQLRSRTPSRTARCCLSGDLAPCMLNRLAKQRPRATKVIVEEGLRHCRPMPRCASSSAAATRRRCVALSARKTSTPPLKFRPRRPGVEKSCAPQKLAAPHASKIGDGSRMAMTS